MSLNLEEIKRAREEADCLADDATVEAALDRMAAEITARLADANPLGLCGDERGPDPRRPHPAAPALPARGRLPARHRYGHAHPGHPARLARAPHPGPARAHGAGARRHPRRGPHARGHHRAPEGRRRRRGAVRGAGAQAARAQGEARHARRLHRPRHPRPLPVRLRHGLQGLLAQRARASTPSRACNTGATPHAGHLQVPRQRRRNHARRRREEAHRHPSARTPPTPRASSPCSSSPRPSPA